MLKSVDDLLVAQSNAADIKKPEERDAENFWAAIKHDVAVHTGKLKMERDRAGIEVPAKPWFKWYYCPFSDSLAKYPNIKAINTQRKNPRTDEWEDAQELKGKHRISGEALLEFATKQAEKQKANKAQADAKTEAKVEKAKAAKVATIEARADAQAAAVKR